MVDVARFEFDEVANERQGIRSTAKDAHHPGPVFVGSAIGGLEGARDIVVDHAEVREFGDIEAVKRAFPGVVTIQELHAEHSDLTFNELQLRVFATCESFVSVLGGASYLASYFGGTNVVYAQKGWEVECGAFDGWFGLFSGARVVAAGTPRELIRAVRRELLGDDASRSGTGLGDVGAGGA